MSRPPRDLCHSALPDADAERYEHALQAAAEWRIRLEEPLPGDRDAFEYWLSAHPDHQQAWQAMDATWQSFSCAARPGSRAALERTFRDERRLSRCWLGASALTLLLLTLLPLGWLVSGLGSPMHLLADHYTHLGERKHVVLADGSELVLNTGTAVDIDYRDDRRVIHLRGGELQVTVAPDSERPLDVVTPEGRARALGTQFTAQRLESAGQTYLSVTIQESRVELCRRVVEECVRLERNQRARASQHELGPVESVDADAEASWVRGQLEVDDQPLTQVLHTLSRYQRGLLSYDEAALAGLRVSGTLPLDDLDRALNALAASQPIQVSRYTPFIVRVTRQY